MIRMIYWQGKLALIILMNVSCCFLFMKVLWNTEPVGVARDDLQARKHEHIVNYGGTSQQNNGGRRFQTLASDGRGFQKLDSDGQGFQKVDSDGRTFQKVTSDGRGFQKVMSDGSLYVYSAYYDPRDGPLLRVFVLSTQVFMNVSYTCRVQLTSGETHAVGGTFSILLTFRPYSYKYVSGVIKCPLTTCCDDSSQLESVSVKPVKKDLERFCNKLSTPLNKLSILKHKLTILFPGDTRPNTLTRCFAALHHNYDKPHKLIWSIEVSRLLGADKFIFYNYSISPVVNKVLRHYMKEGLVEVRVWDIPKAHNYYFGQMISEHDCLMSQTFSAKYVLLADLDEVILSRTGLSLVKLADKIFHYNTDTPKSNLGSLTFRCLSFIGNSSANAKDKIEPKDLVEARRFKIEPLLHTTYFHPYANNKKALVIPERIDRMCVHNACFKRNGFKERTLKSKEAVLLHYRDKPRHMDKKPKFLEFYQMLNYSREIVGVISKKTKLINI